MHPPTPPKKKKKKERRERRGPLLQLEGVDVLSRAHTLAYGQKIIFRKSLFTTQLPKCSKMAHGGRHFAMDRDVIAGRVPVMDYDQSVINLSCL